MLIEHHLHKKIEFISQNICDRRNFYCPKNIIDQVSVYKGGSRFISLNGEFDFAFFNAGQTFDEKANFKKVNVPCCWEYYGVGYTGYVNDRYLFPINPPEIIDSDYGVYKKTFFLIKKKGKRYYINFEGKDSCLYLYVNGQYVGFDSVSHCTSEFDITDFVSDGDNEILVFVYRFCVGSYFECQDKFRLSGLFRDIYILEREEKHIHSYKISYKKLNKSDIEVNISFVAPMIEKSIEVLGENIKVNSLSNDISFIVKNAKLWNSEEPNLYTLRIMCNSEVIYDYLSFRFLELKNNILYLNEQKIKILGINHHDSKYETGYYLSLDDYKKDISLIKNAHMNGVRTSHYPSAPEFLYLCDENGIYVMNEADIECHGAVWTHGGVYNINDFDFVTDNVIFDKIIEDRILRLYTRDVNRQCVLFWSGGNEAGYGQVIIKYLKLLETIDSTRLVHYESLYTGHPERNNYKLSIISQMYPSFDKMKETIANDPRPLILCEYSHAMGNSCGDIHDYVNLFYSNDRFVGGFIWEFNDHLAPINLDFNRPGYGGDFNEPVHSGNFCVDGIVTYQRVPSTNYLEIKAAYAHLQITKEDENFYLLSRYDFVEKNNIVVKFNNQIVEINKIKPGEKVLICKNFDGNFVNFEIFVEGKIYSNNTFVKEDKKQVIDIESDGEFDRSNGLVISNSYYSVKLSEETGLIDTISYVGKKIVNGSSLSFLRAPIDNDQYEIDSWKNEGLYEYKVVLDKIVFNINCLEIFIKCSPIGKGRIIYQLNKKQLNIKVIFDVNESISYLPRLGYTLFIDKKFKSYSYVGYGPYESYCDKKYLDYYGEFSEEISKDILYVKPQETMSHLANKVSVNSGEMIFEFTGMNSFSYLPYSIKELMSKKHNYDLVMDTERNYLSLDYMMSGVGTHACGPELLDKYKLKEKHIEYYVLMEAK